ncbi:MAG: HEAT repeat domain-containing protein [Opitutaceae bacterium]|nr:HEAT repeat domain-containing protein [Verrucomicrobiales bacterium]
MHWWTLQQLKSKNPAARQKAAETLSEQASPEIVPSVKGLLSDGEATVRRAAVQTLGKVDSEEVVALIIPLLRDPAAEVRAAAAEALKSRRHPTAIGPLKEVMIDPAGVVRGLAAQALEAHGWRPDDEVEEALLAVARGEWDHASRLGAVSVKPLTAVLQGEEIGLVRHAVLKALGKIKASSVTGILVGALQDVDATVRTEAAISLGQAGDVTAVEPLIVALNDPHHRVQAAAANALSRMGDARSIEPLSRLLPAGHWEVRMAAAEALSNIGDARVIEPLIGALQDRDKDVRMMVAQALGQLRNTLAVEPLILAMIDQEDGVRQAAALSLKLLDRNWEKSAAARRVLPQIDAALSHREYWVRQSAATLLVQITQIQSDEPSLANVSARNKQYRQMAYDTLISLLDDEDRDFRMAAAEGLGRIGDARAIGPLTARLKDDDQRVRGVVAGTLQKLQRQPDVIRPLRMMNAED